MKSKIIIPPRQVPDKHEKYMGLAWIHASFSKDPNTQVGAQIVDKDNTPLGSGYNGPPRKIDDNSFSWCRPPKNNPDEFCKYDVIIHAEINAIKHSCGYDLSNSTLYVTGFPCKDCMKEIAKEEISKVVYFDHKSDSNSMMRKTQKDKSKEIARLAGIDIEEFTGSVAWLRDWNEKLKLLGVFKNVI